MSIKLSWFRLLALFSLSVTLLAFELTIMRLFAVGSWSNFGSMVISICLLGFGLAGTLLTLIQKRVLRNPDAWLFASAFLMGPAMALAQLVDLGLVGGVQDDTAGAVGGGTVLEVEARCVFGGVSVTPRDGESPASWTVPAAASRDDAFEQAEAEAAEAAAEEGTLGTDPAAGTAGA